VDHLEHCDALEAEIALFAEVLDRADTEAPVPSCPGWSVLDLAEHTGRMHRRAEYLVRNLVPGRTAIPPAVDAGGPFDGAWIHRGGTRLLSTLRQTDPGLDMWAWGADQHVRFWSRRQHHETLVHRVDLQLAVGRQPRVDVGSATDAIDEFLVNLSAATTFSPRIDELRNTRGRLAFWDAHTGRRWVVGWDPSGVGLARDTGPVDAELTAAGPDLLLVLYRRRSVDDIDCLVDGDRGQVRVWLDHSALE